MMDPLAEVIALLRPRAVFSKVIGGAGAWAVRYSAFGQPSFCTMLEGECVLSVDKQEPVTLKAGTRRTGVAGSPEGARCDG
jgi:hypothetical protein